MQWEAVLSHLRCPRCDGLMRREKIIFEGEICSSWICTICGEVVDQVILENRTLRSKKMGEGRFKPASNDWGKKDFRSEQNLCP